MRGYHLVGVGVKARDDFPEKTKLIWRDEGTAGSKNLGLWGKGAYNTFKELILEGHWGWSSERPGGPEKYVVTFTFLQRHLWLQVIVHCDYYGDD